MSISAVPVVDPVRVPKSVLLVLQLTVPNQPVGTVTSVPVERTVPLGPAPIVSTLMLPVLWTTTGSKVQLVNDQVEIGPLTVGPVKTDVAPSTFEELHVPAATPVVSDMSIVVSVVSDASSVTEPVCVTPFVASVVAEAVLANAIRAIAVTAATPSILLSFMSLSSVTEPDARRVWTEQKPPPLPGAAARPSSEGPAASAYATTLM